MTYPMPEKVTLPDGKIAIFDHATDYTEDPRPNETRPPHGQIFAYYKVEMAEPGFHSIAFRIKRVPVSVKQAKFSPSQLPTVIATLLSKIP